MTLRSVISRWLGRNDTARISEWDLATPLLNWSPDDPWTIRDAVEGTLILGGTGRGKSSGSGRAVAAAMLRHGFGGLVLTAKSDERETWQRYCAEAGRTDDLIVFGPDGPWKFNFLDHERGRKGAGAGLTENIVNLLSTAVEVSERNTGGGGHDNDGYFRRATLQLMRGACDLLLLGPGRISVPDLYRLVISAPTSREQGRSEEWRERSFCFHCLLAAEKRPKSPREQADFDLVADYFLVEFAQLAERTRSGVVSTFTSTVDVLNRGVLRDAFCGETTVTPEVTEAGKIILIDFPVKEFGQVGLIAQALFKYALQRSIERREVTPNTRPVFVYADEAQNFATSYDMQFQATCRSARVAVVLLSQNISNFHAALGGTEKSKAETASLFANLSTKVFHGNGDPVTNEWAATIIGRSLQQFASANSSSSAEDRWGSVTGMDWLGHAGNTSAGFSESYDFELQPSAFTRLRGGGPTNGWVVDGIVVQDGRAFHATGKTWLPVTFAQRR